MAKRHVLSMIVLICALWACSGGRPGEGENDAGPPAHVGHAIERIPPIPVPSAEAADVPQGFRVEAVVVDLSYPTSVEFDEEGRLYVAEAGYVYGDDSAPARILRVSSDELEVVAEGLEGPVTDLLWHRGKLLISHRGKVSVLEPTGRLKDIVEGLPSDGDHHNNQLVAGPDGKIYLGQGTATNSGVVGVDNFLFGWLSHKPNVRDVPARDLRLTHRQFETMNPLRMAEHGAHEGMKVKTGAFRRFGETAGEADRVAGALKANGVIFRMNPDGSHLEVFAWGLRNPFGLAWTADGKLYASDNGYDERGSRPIAHAPDCLWEVKPGAWYGFPDFVAGVPVTDPRFKPKHGPAPEFLLEEHPPVEKPVLELPRHCAAAKMEFSKSAEFGHEGELFMAQAGDMIPITGGHDERSGFQVVRVNVATRKAEPFFRAKKTALGPKGLEHVVTSAPKRPVDVRFSPDGTALYVADVGSVAVLPGPVSRPKAFEGTGVIWRISRVGREVAGPKPGISAKPGAHLIR